MDEETQLIKIFWQALVLMVSLGLFSCNPTEISTPDGKWLPTQVRILDLSESRPNPVSSIDPHQDLIALYSRENKSELEIRLDLLDLELQPIAGLHLKPGFDLYLELDFIAGGPGWDLGITIPANGVPEIHPFANQPFSDIKPRLHLDAQLDYLKIGIQRAGLPDLRPGYFLHAYLTEPDSSTIIDEIPVTYSGTTIDPLPLLLTFRNTFPAHTPAQALRRWDGAHTGPLGKRHGLKHLLDASRAYQIPVVLLDLKTPTNLAALELLGQLQDIAVMQRAGLAILPEPLPEPYFGNLPAWAYQRAAQSSRQTALRFGLTTSPFLYSPGQLVEQGTGYELIFIRQQTKNNPNPLTTHNTSSQGRNFIYLPGNNGSAFQAGDQGLSLESRYTLFESAHNHSSDELAIINQDLPHSTLGDPQIASKVFHYLAEHPWIQVISSTDLLTLDRCTDCSHPKLVIQSSIKHPVMADLQSQPPNPISDLAWQFFLDLSAPADTVTPELAILRQTYLGEIGNLLAAAEWNSGNAQATTIRNPSTVNCALDSDYDGRPECMLANEDYFALLDPDGGRLALFFAYTTQGVIQLVGASSQFVVGLSDPSEWNSFAGPLADPANIPGALAGPWVEYEITELADGVRFAATGVEKVFKLSDTGLQIQIKTKHLQSYQIPLAVAPEMRFLPGWIEQYRESEIHQGWVWGIKDGPKVAITTSSELTSHNFQESGESLLHPENPNLGYPPGHFLPFPLAVVDLPTQTELWLLISLFANQPPDQ